MSPEAYSGSHQYTSTSSLSTPLNLSLPVRPVDSTASARPSTSALYRRRNSGESSYRSTRTDLHTKSKFPSRELSSSGPERRRDEERDHPERISPPRGDRKRYRSPSPRYHRPRSPLSLHRRRRSPSPVRYEHNQEYRPSHRSPPPAQPRYSQRERSLDRKRLASRSPSPRTHHRTSRRTSRDIDHQAHRSERYSAEDKIAYSGSRRDAHDQPKSLKDRLGPISGVLDYQEPLTKTEDLNSSNTIPVDARSKPAATLAVPTGPRADRSATGSQNFYPSKSLPSYSSSQYYSGHDFDMPGPSRYRHNGHSGPRKPAANGPATTGNARQLTPPLRDHAQIMEQYGSDVMLKSQWSENPKAPLANFLGGGRGGADLNAEYRTEEGLVGNKKVFRVSVMAEPGRNIVGTGDHSNKKEAEKLAALSAVLQLTAAGLLEKTKSSGKAAAPAVSAFANAPSGAVSGGSSDTAKLSDGEVISYDRARQFMEYYCHRYRFGKPDIEFSQTSSKGRKGKMAVMTWDAVMTVGGKRIGMGSSNNKKGAQVKAYLDVSQYLESCDPDLWRDFVEHSKKDKSASLGMAPHLVFQMSDNLNDDIQGLCGDIRHSRLWEKAPASGAVAHDSQPLTTWGGGRNRELSEKELTNKSLDLQDRLAAYHSEPNLEKMRKQRAALPVKTKATEILAKIEVNDVTIVMAATGSGKTTQVPQLIFDDYINRGDGAKCNIVCTQPRRLAAMSVAERIADERGQRLGEEIGYQVRFDVKLPQPNGCVTFCTTGIFLKRMQSALGPTADANAVRRMDEVTHIVVDEVHERDIDTDLLLVVLKRLLADRRARQKPIKIILMSATIDPTLFQTYFADPRGRLAPIAEIPGRTFPVERFHLDDIVPQLEGLPPNKGGWVFNEKNVVEYLSKELSRDPNNFGPGSGMALEIPYPLVALTIADVMKRSDDGHVLVFLPGWDEIKKVADILMDTRGRPLLGLNFNDSTRFSIHYLHSTIPAAEQKEVFKPPPEGVRRIILATNIAETSITIPDVVYVVDTARVKEKRYDPERHMSSLVSAWVGSSNLNQRAGRAGRHREGEYYGLLSKRRLAALEAHQTVEMKRSDLSNVVMHVKALNLGEVEEVLAATIEPPEPNRIVAAMEVLRMLGAMDAEQNLTSLGRVLLQLPVEAAIGKLCLYGSVFRCLDSALTLAAVLTNRDPFLAPIALKAQADQIKDSWSPLAFRSDPLAIVAAYDTWSAMDDQGNYRSANAFCSDNFLSKPTMLQIKQVKGSLLQSLDQAGVVAVSAGGSVHRIGRQTTVPPALNEHGNSLPLLAALIAMASAPNFALRTSDKTCRTSQDKTVFIHASSVNSRRREAGGPEEASASFNPAEKRIYAFGEKSRNVPLGGKETGGITQLRSVTRLDPMTYMLFGAYELVVTQRGLECDRWLPVTGNLDALDDVQRLKVLLDGCMLRVFEGVGKSLTQGRDQRWRAARSHVEVRSGSSRIRDGDVPGEGDAGENESDDEDDESGEAAYKARKRVVEPLSMDEIKELELLTTDVVRILDAYAAEREGGSVVSSRPVTPGPGGHAGSSGPPYGGGNVYRPPQASQNRSRKW